MSEPSQAWRRFVDDVKDGGPRRSFTYDTENFEHMTPPERDAAGTLLMIRARDEQDALAIETLSKIGLDLLDSIGLPPQASLHRSAWLRCAAWLRRTDDSITALTQDAAEDPAAISAAMSAHTLALLPGDRARDGLIALVDSTSALARVHAWQGLIDRLDLSEWEHPPQAPLARLWALKDCPIPSVWQPAAATFRRMVEELTRGATPEDVGLHYVSNTTPGLLARVWGSFAEPEGPVDTVGILRLRGHDRAAAEARLLFQFTVFHRARALEALLELQPAGLVEWLAEQASWLEVNQEAPELRLQIAAVLDVLRS